MHTMLSRSSIPILQRIPRVSIAPFKSVFAVAARSAPGRFALRAVTPTTCCLTYAAFYIMAAPTSTAASTSASTSEVTIRELNPSVTIFSRPFVRTGCEVGVRMSAIRLSSGDLVIYNPTELDEPTRSKLSSLGTVKYVVTPNLVHHMFAGPFAAAFPEARFIGPEGIQAKKKDAGVTFAVEMKDAHHDHSADIGWGTDVEYQYFPDFAQKEIALFHKPTKTLFLADMLWNLPANEQYTNVHDQSRQPIHASAYGLQAAVAAHLQPEGWLGKALAWVADKATPEFKAGMHRVVEKWQPTTIVPEHGDVITSDADKKLRSTYSWVKWDH